MFTEILEKKEKQEILGPAGADGAAGKDGTDGKDGVDGEDGIRGTGIYKITTAPSSYTTTVGGFTPTYRIALSTVLSQSGAEEIIVGDQLRYSYYLYPVGYVDSSYVYCGTRQSIRGATGATGAAGADGIGVSAIVSEYYLSTSNTAQEGGEWSEEQTEWEDGKYFWTRSKITWTDSTVTYTDPILAEGINNANENVSIVKESVAEQKITIDSIQQTVSETQTIVGNNYNELKTKFDDYAPKSDVITLQTSVEKIQTDTYTKTEINTKLTDGSVTKVSTTAGTFDENGLTIEKTNAKTKGNFNETGITVTDATSGSDEELLFAGYDDELGETIVRSKNMTVEKYFVVGNTARQEKYTNPVLGGKGIGVFIL